MYKINKQEGYIIQGNNHYIVVVEALSCVWLFVIPWTAACQAFLPFTVSQSLLKFTSIELLMPSNHLILCHPLLLPPIFPSIRVLSRESALCIRWPKFWSFSFSPSDEHSGLISIRIDRFALLVVQGTLKSLLWGCYRAPVWVPWVLERISIGYLFYKQQVLEMHVK